MVDAELNTGTYPHELHDRVIDARAMWQPEAATRAKLIEEK